MSDEDGKELTITIPNHGILGTAGVDGNNIECAGNRPTRHV